MANTKMIYFVLDVPIPLPPGANRKQIALSCKQLFGRTFVCVAISWLWLRQTTIDETDNGNPARNYHGSIIELSPA